LRPLARMDLGLCLSMTAAEQNRSVHLFDEYDLLVFRYRTLTLAERTAGDTRVGLFAQLREQRWNTSRLRRGLFTEPFRQLITEGFGRVLGVVINLELADFPVVHHE